ncbi:MAG TPA: hypothetical protein VHB02_15240 [Acidimicrobiales bacterium]|nr:hypothetical protein [Acidimicrobiales bacterium]
MRPDNVGPESPGKDQRSADDQLPGTDIGDDALDDIVGGSAQVIDPSGGFQ